MGCESASVITHILQKLTKIITTTDINKKALLLQEYRAMPQPLFLV